MNFEALKLNPELENTLLELFVNPVTLTEALELVEQFVRNKQLSKGQRTKLYFYLYERRYGCRPLLIGRWLAQSNGWVRTNYLTRSRNP